MVIGIVAAFVLLRGLTAFLFEVEPTDPVMLGLAGVLFAVIGLLRAGCRRGARQTWIRSRRFATSDLRRPGPKA